MCQLAYCENDVECRRTLQLAHLDETFGRDKCGGTCDTCEKGVVAEERDATALAKVIVRAILQASTASALLIQQSLCEL